MGKAWKNPIKEQIAQKKGKLFTKLAKEISVAARLGGADPEGNPRLKLAIQNARAASCPKDTIERAIKKGAGLLDGENQIEELTYEGMAPFNVGVIVECQTDNKNRTVSELRAAFKKNGGHLAESGSVLWMFERISLIEGTKEGEFDPEEEAIEAGANDVIQNEDGTYSFIGEKEDLDQIRKTLLQRGWDIQVAELSYKPKNLTELKPEEKEQVIEFLKKIDDLDDTARVHATIE
ncbi:MAG: YebC/PmpR family DNA-binding transcriptional regulator [Bdellovibrio sp.]|nr:MAG: YebC/PmpR family DNA-binding transcriptional regulator [Bdellovibrio sp.]